MEDQLDFKEVPYNFLLCLQRECPKATTCLRRVAEQSAPDSLTSWPLLRPSHLASLGGDCPYYRSSAPIRYAKGFMGILDNLSAKQMRKVVRGLIGQFSKRTYYRIRKGERLLSPVEQGWVLSIVKRCGVEQPGDFDAYQEGHDWE